jgi:hypothetical protein
MLIDGGCGRHTLPRVIRGLEDIGNATWACASALKPGRSLNLGSRKGLARPGSNLPRLCGEQYRRGCQRRAADVANLARWMSAASAKSPTRLMKGLGTEGYRYTHDEAMRLPRRRYFRTCRIWYYPVPRAWVSRRKLQTPEGRNREKGWRVFNRWRQNDRSHC